MKRMDSTRCRSATIAATRTAIMLLTQPHDHYVDLWLLDIRLHNTHMRLSTGHEVEIYF